MFSFIFRYFIGIIPGIILFSVTYLFSPDKINLILRDFGKVAFFYLILTLLITPLITLLKRPRLNLYRRVFWVLSFFSAIAHAGVYFSQEFQYHGTFFVLKHFQEPDVFSGTIAFFIIFVLGITSNDFSLRLLRSSWKKIQVFVYPLTCIVILHVAFASRFDIFYMVLIGILIFLRTAAYLKK